MTAKFDQYLESQYQENGEEYWNNLIDHELVTPETIPQQVLAERISQKIFLAMSDLVDEFKENDVPNDLAILAVTEYLEQVDVDEEVRSWADMEFNKKK